MTSRTTKGTAMRNLAKPALAHALAVAAVLAGGACKNNDNACVTGTHVEGDVCVADILEYDLVAFLEGWRARFERLAG